MESLFKYNKDTDYQFEIADTIKFLIDGIVVEEQPNKLKLLGEARYEDFIIYGKMLLNSQYAKNGQVLKSLMRSWNHTICESGPADYTMYAGNSLHRC